MRALSWPVSFIGSVIGALRYELVRLRGVRSLRGVVFSALGGSVILTLPAAREVVGLGQVLPPQPRSAHSGSLVGQAALGDVVSRASAFGSQHVPVHGAGAWVVAGGVAGMVLPGIAAAVGAAWFGATSIGYEYRHGSGLLTFTLLPRRGSVLVAKVLVAAVFGALLCLGTTVVAYGTAWLGFRVAGVRVALPAGLLAPGPREVAVAALGGALGVFGGAVLRARVLGVVAALAGCALVAAFLPRSVSLAVPHLGSAARYVVRAVPGVSYGTASELLLGLPLAALVLMGLVVVRRRRIA